MASQAQLQKQQGEPAVCALRYQTFRGLISVSPELQTTYQTYKNTLQTIASKIGDIEQETEEHKYARQSAMVRKRR